MATDLASPPPALIVERLLHAPIDLVWRAWIEPGQMASWLGPSGFTCPAAGTDPRIGGGWRAWIRGPDGVGRGVGGIYREIRAPARLVFTFAWEDLAGDPKEESVVTLTLAEAGPVRTRLALSHAPFANGTIRDTHRAGWTESIDRLAAYVAGLDRGPRPL